MNSFPSTQQVQSLLTILSAPLSLSMLMPLAYLVQLLSVCEEIESRHPPVLGV